MGNLKSEGRSPTLSRHKRSIPVGVVLGLIFETLAELAFVGGGLRVHEKHPRAAGAILAVVLALVAGILVWAFWLAPTN